MKQNTDSRPARKASKKAAFNIALRFFVFSEHYSPPYEGCDSTEATEEQISAYLLPYFERQQEGFCKVLRKILSETRDNARVQRLIANTLEKFGSGILDG